MSALPLRREGPAVLVALPFRRGRRILSLGVVVKGVRGEAGPDGELGVRARGGVNTSVAVLSVVSLLTTRALLPSMPVVDFELGSGSSSSVAFLFRPLFGFVSVFVAAVPFRTARRRDVEDGPASAALLEALVDEREISSSSIFTLMVLNSAGEFADEQLTALGTAKVLPRGALLALS